MEAVAEKRRYRYKRINGCVAKGSVAIPANKITKIYAEGVGQGIKNQDKCKLRNIKRLL